MTRGGDLGTRRGEEWGRGDGYWRCDTRGFDSTKTHDDTGLQTPPEKKSKKNFSGSNFFFKKKFFAGFGVSVIMGFYLKPNPCHRGFLGPGLKPRVIMGFGFHRVIMGGFPPESPSCRVFPHKSPLRPRYRTPRGTQCGGNPRVTGIMTPSIPEPRKPGGGNKSGGSKDDLRFTFRHGCHEESTTNSCRWHPVLVVGPLSRK